MATIKAPRADMDAVRAGDKDALIRGAAFLVADLLRTAGSSIADPCPELHVVAKGDLRQVGLIAAAVALRNLLAQSPAGRETLHGLCHKSCLDHIGGE